MDGTLHTQRCCTRRGREFVLTRTVGNGLWLVIALVVGGCDYLVRMDTSVQPTNTLQVSFFEDDKKRKLSRERLAYVKVERVHFEKTDTSAERLRKSDVVWELGGKATVDGIVYGQVPDGMIEIVGAMPLKKNSLYWMWVTVDATFATGSISKYFETDSAGLVTPLTTANIRQKYLIEE